MDQLKMGALPEDIEKAGIASFLPVPVIAYFCVFGNFKHNVKLMFLTPA